MARFTSQKGQGADGGTGQVLKLAEAIVTTPVTTITATFTPVVNLSDYSEFWFIVTGSLSAQDDIFLEINNLTSSSYNSHYTRVAGVTQTIVDNGGSLFLALNDSASGVAVLINTPFYAKAVLMGNNGGAPVADTSQGSLFCKYNGSGAGNSNNYITGAWSLDWNNTTLDQIIFKTGGVANLTTGSRITIYGVKRV